MAYLVDWVAKVITIPAGDLTLVAGTHYSLAMSDFHEEVRRLEWEFDDGLWAPQILDHTNTRFDFAGVTYAPFDEIVNGYTIQFGAGPTRVDLVGSNNNIIDTLIPTGVSVVPNNSAGLVIAETGTSGLTAEESAQLEAIAKYSTNKVEISVDRTTVTIYDDDGLTPFKVFNLSNDLRTRAPQ